MAQGSKGKLPTTTRRRIILRRRRKLPVIRLGGTAADKAKRGIFIVRVMRRMRLRWLKLHYIRMIKKLKQYYRAMVKDLMEASSSIEMLQQRALAFSTFPSTAVAGATTGRGSDAALFM